jgi:ribosome-associated protein
MRSCTNAHYNPGMLEVSPAVIIPDAELVERFVRSAGPGGQNVNKVATAVELRFDIANSPSLPEPVRARLLAKRDRRITDDGVFVLSAQRFRTQERNREDARERLAAFIATGLRAPVPRIATRPSRASKERRLGAKKERSTIKRGRAVRDWD